MVGSGLDRSSGDARNRGAERSRPLPTTRRGHPRFWLTVPTYQVRSGLSCPCWAH